VFIHLTGKLDEKALAAAIHDLMLRHESLRASFSADGQQLIIAKDCTITLTRHDYQAQTEDEAAARLQVLRTQVVGEAFDLFNGPLARFDLIRLAPEKYSLLMTFHHSICDGWSLYVIADDLGHLYSAQVENRLSDLPSAPSFAEYADWERSEDTLPLRTESLAYWQQKFRNGAPCLELPYDYSRPMQRSFSALRQDKTVSMDTVALLKKLSSVNRSTLNTTLMAGFAAYLHRLSGSLDIVLGVPFAGQMAKEEHTLVGHCVNIIPLYIQLTGKETFNELIAKVQKGWMHLNINI
jgi:NRPS condensation-like uncharacterized protein